MSNPPATSDQNPDAPPLAQGSGAGAPPLGASMVWAIAFAVMIGVLVASTLAIVIRTYTPLPKWDQWAEVIWAKNYYAGQWHLSDFWQQHNEHRILFPRIFLAIDWFLFKGTNVFLLACMLLLQAGHAWIFVREVRGWKELSREIRLTMIALIVGLFFSGANLDNFTWGFQISFILVFYSATLSIYAAIRCAENSWERPGRSGLGWLALCVASGIVATYSLSNGILLWPILLLVGFLLRVRRQVMLLLAASSVLLGALYLAGYHSVAIHTRPLDALKQPFSVLGYISAYLALPLSKINHVVGVSAGFLVLLAFGWETWRIVRRRTAPSRLVALCLGVMLFVTAGAFVTALGRISVGAPESALRYATPVSIFWACGLLLMIAEAGTFPQRSVATAAILAATITAFGTTILPLHVDSGIKLIEVADSLKNAELALLVGVAAPDAITPVFPDVSLPLQFTDVLRVHRRSIFAGEPMSVGEPLPAGFQIVNRSQCRGTWEDTSFLDGPRKLEASASGWAWDTAQDRRPQRIVFVDDARVVRGLAGFTQTRSDVAAALRNSRMISSGWFGFAKRTPATPAYRAYALLHDGRSLCELGTPADVHGAVYAIFRHGQWFIDTNRSGVWEPEDRTFHFGLDGDIPVAGDWDGSGVTRAGVYRNGVWYLDWNNNGEWDAGDRRIEFGLPGDLPIVGDWGHTGVTKIGVFRNGVWILDWKGTQTPTSGTRQFVYGEPGDIPVAGDWDGSGVTRIGVYRHGIWFLDVNGDFQFGSGDKSGGFGLPADQPVTGDWNGLGTTKLGVFRGGTWILDSDGNLQWSSQDATRVYGLAGDIAVSWK